MVNEESLKLVLQTVPPAVSIVAASKYTNSSQIKIAYEMGIRHFGESRVQDAEQKKAELSDLTEINWHMIGHLQTNKVRKAVQIFDWIHSVDRLELLEKINLTARELGKKPNLLLQVKLAPDESKSGFTEPELWENLPIMLELSNIPIKGLMTILPFGLASEERYKLFCRLAQLKDEINQRFGTALSELSMGMSGDYEEALKAGTTILRIGKAIFL